MIVRTVAWNSGESDVEFYSKFLASTSVNYDRGINVDPPVVHEFNHAK